MEFSTAKYLDAHKAATAAISFADKNLGDIGDNLSSPRLTAMYALERAGDLDRARQSIATLLHPELTSKKAGREGQALLALGVLEMSAGDLDAADIALTHAKVLVQGNPSREMLIARVEGEVLLRRGANEAALSKLSQLAASYQAKFGSKSHENALIMMRLGVAQARTGATEDARRNFSDAQQWIHKTRVISHPDRVRVDGYVALLSDSISNAEKVMRLDLLTEKVSAGRGDRIALIPSLGRAKAWLQLPPQANIPNNFPLLD